MNQSRIKNISPLAETQFVGLYDVEYKNKVNEDKHWMVATRKSKEELEAIYSGEKEDEIDAVVIAALHKSTNKIVMIKQFRVPINNYIYELPAGLVDNHENMEHAVSRELKEETGLDLISINKINSMDKLYLSPGMTDESVAFVYCTCDGEVSKEFLEDDEEIETYLLSQEDAKEIVNRNEKIDIKAFLILQMFANLGEKLF